MPAPMKRRSVLALSAIAAVTLLGLALLPLIASRQIVRDRIAEEMSVWTGYEVEVGNGTEIDVWPTFRATLRDVRFSTEAGELVLRTDRVEIAMSALAALSGELYYNRVRFIRPILMVKPATQFGFLPSPPRKGKIHDAVEGARLALRDAPGTPDPSRLPSDELGRVEVSEGRIVGPDGDVATGIEAALDWPVFAGRADATLEAIWRGEPLTVTVRSERPLFHLAGASAPLDLSLTSPKLTVTYTGAAGLRPGSTVDGLLSIGVASLRDTIGWLRPEMAAGFSTAPLEFSSRTGGSAEELKFENAAIRLGTTAGLGGFELMTSGERPKLAGSLAFDSLDLPPLTQTATMLLPPVASRSASMPEILRNLDLDLRVSASNAQSGPLVLTDMAATAQVNVDQSLIDISDASLFGGTLQAALRIERHDDHPAELRVDLRDFDGAEAGDALGLAAALPAARGSLTLSLTGAGQDLAALSSSAAGNINLQFGPGTLRGLSIDGFTAALRDDGFFPLSSVTAGDQPVEGINLELNIGAGQAEIAQARLIAANREVRLSGIVAQTGGLALFGSLGSESAQLPPQSFFVGGTWGAPYVSRALPPATDF